MRMIFNTSIALFASAIVSVAPHNIATADDNKAEYENGPPALEDTVQSSSSCVVCLCRQERSKKERTEEAEREEGF